MLTRHKLIPEEDPALNNLADSRLVTMRLLATLPIYRRWQNRAISPAITRWIDHADAQQLMTAAAAILTRLTQMK
ncbi:MAG: hypothetical protein WD294_00175 [Phycisphaeraceae bacterium]